MSERKSALTWSIPKIFRKMGWIEEEKLDVNVNFTIHPFCLLSHLHLPVACPQLFPKGTEGERNPGGTRKTRDRGDVVSREQSYPGGCLWEHRAHISKKAASIRAVAQGTTCLLMQLCRCISPPARPVPAPRCLWLHHSQKTEPSTQKTQSNTTAAENLSNQGPSGPKCL